MSKKVKITTSEPTRFSSRGEKKTEHIFEWELEEDWANEEWPLSSRLATFATSCTGFMAYANLKKFTFEVIDDE